MASRAARSCLALSIAAALLLSAAPAASPARAGTDAIPDLAVAPLTDFQIQWVGGQRLLRFSATMVNPGAGPFELRGSRESTSEPMSISQIMYPDGRVIATAASAHFAGDGHNHWHVADMMRYDVWGPSGTQRGTKVGFCFLDTDRMSGTTSDPVYTGCGTNPNALSIQMGISVGWGDKYDWSIANQWVDITGLPTGSYTVRAKVDPNGFFLESNELNQCAFATVSLSTASDAVTVTNGGDACVNDWSESQFAGDIEWAFATGITVGRGADLFCTNNGVTREQMASFLARALTLPPTGTDFFTDDEASIHEDDINRIAAAGITVGCAAAAFCPHAGLNREQMASFLVRAFELPPTDGDFFTDDEASAHEGDINAVAAAGVTFGCGPSSFCPMATVTRGQMAAFLHRAVG
jgi:hypothetical protein